MHFVGKESNPTVKPTPRIVLLYVIFVWQYSSVTSGTDQIAAASPHTDVL